MKNNTHAIMDATGEAIEYLFMLRDAAENHRAAKSEAAKRQFTDTAYRLENVRNTLFSALRGRFDSFAAVAAAPVRFGPLVCASAHEALYNGFVMLAADAATDAKEFLHLSPTDDALNELSALLQMENAKTGASIKDAKPAATTNDARNKWVYKQCRKLVKYSLISRQVGKKTKWEPLPTPQSVRSAATRYAKTHNLPPIPSRQPGRPPK